MTHSAQPFPNSVHTMSTPHRHNECFQTQNLCLVDMVWHHMNTMKVLELWNTSSCHTMSTRRKFSTLKLSSCRHCRCGVTQNISQFENIRHVNVNVKSTWRGLNWRKDWPLSATILKLTVLLMSPMSSCRPRLNQLTFFCPPVTIVLVPSICCYMTDLNSSDLWLNIRSLHWLLQPANGHAEFSTKIYLISCLGDAVQKKILSRAYDVIRTRYNFFCITFHGLCRSIPFSGCSTSSSNRFQSQQVLSSSWDGRPFGHNRHGPKIGGLCPFWGSWMAM